MSVTISVLVCVSQATVESQLRNAIQTQLDGVDKGLGSLREYVCLSVCLSVCLIPARSGSKDLPLSMGQ